MVTTQLQVLKSDMALVLNDLTKDLQQVGDRVSTNEDDIAAMSQELEKSQEAQTKLEEEVKALWDKCTDLEDRSCRDNIRLRNV